MKINPDYTVIFDQNELAVLAFYGSEPLERYVQPWFQGMIKSLEYSQMVEFKEKFDALPVEDQTAVTDILAKSVIVKEPVQLIEEL